MRYWKEHMGLRALLMTIFFIGGMVLLIGGWMMQGQLTGLGIMVLGLVLLLLALQLYNRPFEEPK